MNPDTARDIAIADRMRQDSEDAETDRLNRKLAHRQQFRASLAPTQTEIASKIQAMEETK